MALPWLTNRELERPEVMARAVDALEAMFLALPTGALETPKRTLLITGDGLPQRQMLIGAVSWGARNLASVKVTTLTPDNPKAGLDLIQGLVLVIDLATGKPLALIEGGALTGLRTGALAALAVRHLAPANDGILTLIGAGVQARWALLALLGQARFSTLRLASRGTARRDTLAHWAAPRLAAGQQIEICNSIDQAVAGADIICTATSVSTQEFPVVEEGWIRGNPLCIALGGANETACEFDPKFVTRCQLFVEDRAAALDDAGELRAAHLPSEALTSISDVIIGHALPDPCRPRLFRSVGLAAEDLAGVIAALND